MSDPQNNTSPETPKSYMANNIIERTTTAIVQFVFSYLYTVWVLFRWPFRKSLDILDEDVQSRFLPPYSFLFVNIAFFYFMSERFIKLLDLKTQFNTDGQIKLIPAFSPSNYSLESFTYNTAPIIIIVIALSHIAAWVLGFQRNTAKRKVHSAVCYVSAYLMLLPSIGTLLIGLVIENVLNSIAVPGKKYIETQVASTGTDVLKFAEYLLIPLLIYFSVSVITILISFTGSTKQQTDIGLKHIPSFVIPFLVIVLFITAGISSSISVTTYRLAGQLNLNDYFKRKNAGMGKVRLPAVAVISHEKKSIEKNELPLSLAITNTCDKNVLLFTFTSIDKAMTLVADEDGHKWNCRFVPLPGQEQFLSVDPGAVATLRGVLVPKEGTWRELMNKRRNLRLEMKFLGSYPKTNVSDVFYITIDNERVKQLFMTGFKDSEQH